MAHSASGKRYARCSRPPKNSGAGFISKPMCLPPCRNQRTRRRCRRSRRSTTPRISTRPRSRSRPSRSTSGPSTPRRSPRSPTIWTPYWSSTTIPPSTGSTYARQIRSKAPLPTVRLRTKVTKGPGSRAAGLAMAYKLIDAAAARWRAVNAPHLVALVRAGAVFHKGKLLERPTEITPPTPPSDGDQQAGTEVAWNTPIHRYWQFLTFASAVVETAREAPTATKSAPTTVAILVAIPAMSSPPWFVSLPAHLFELSDRGCQKEYRTSGCNSRTGSERRGECEQVKTTGVGVINNNAHRLPRGPHGPR